MFLAGSEPAPPPAESATLAAISPDDDFTDSTPATQFLG